VISSHAPRATILIRLVVGAVFVSEGIQKFCLNMNFETYPSLRRHLERAGGAPAACSVNKVISGGALKRMGKRLKPMPRFT